MASQNSKTGDGSSVGLFIPIPERLARWFPSRKPQDDSPPHVTFFVVGEVPPNRVDDLRRACTETLSYLGKVKADLGPMDYFDTDEHRVAFLSVNFDQEMGHARALLRERLRKEGFDLEDKFFQYHPHATLSYMEPGSKYQEPLPDTGLWEFDHMELWGLPTVVKVPTTRKKSAKGKYKDKKKDDEGNVHYEYGPRQISKRNKEKAKRVEDLRKKIDDLRKKVKSDLSSSQEETKNQSLAVALMDATYERVGNDESASDGHFGVTGWQVKHVTFKGDKAVLNYVGKSGVKQKKEVKDPSLVSALKKATKGKKGDDEIITISAKEVNEYLKLFDITAKDIRGFHANLEMKNALEEVRKKGPELPRSRKEKDEILKKEFNKALEKASEAVGHESATLKSNYLVPGFEERYLHDGTIVEEFDMGKKATKTKAEKEDEEAERLSRPSPKKKPPRKDKRRNRVDIDEDSDTDQDDPDMSLNYKRVGTAKKTQSFPYSRTIVNGRVTRRSCNPNDRTRRAIMPRKITKKGAQEVNSMLDRIANLFENEYEALDIPQRIARDLAYRIDLASDHIARTAGFDPKEIASEEAGPLEGDSDEPYMSGNFTEKEHHELGQKQKSGLSGADKRAALEALIESGASPKTIVAFLTKSASEDTHAKYALAKLAEEEDSEEDAEDSEEEGASKKAHGFNLFG